MAPKKGGKKGGKKGNAPKADYLKRVGPAPAAEAYRMTEFQRVGLTGLSLAHAQRTMCPVKLTAADGSVFILEKSAAEQSGTLRQLLEGQSELLKLSADNFGGEVRLPELSARILEQVVQYLHYKLQTASAAAGRRVPPPKFDVHPDIARELLHAADVLDC